jgi:hypothetical protein
MLHFVTSWLGVPSGEHDGGLSFVFVFPFLFELRPSGAKSKPPK